MSIFAILVFIGFALSWYFRSWGVFNHVIGYGAIFASIPLGLKFASVAGLNPIVVFFIYVGVFWIVYLSKEALRHRRPSPESVRTWTKSKDFCKLAQYLALTCISFMFEPPYLWEI